ncbi:MAG: HAMP domain-containing histidine kinase [Clostridiaceae bacterium]|nr:HAMP domain-containing histidine kinase [Clostridiaceae bacterium]
MRMRYNLNKIILGTIVFNILILLGYYILIASVGFYGDYNTLNENLDGEVSQIAERINENQEYYGVLDYYIKNENLIFKLTDLDGNVVYESGEHKLNFFYINSVKPVRISDEIYLLKVIKPLEKDEIIKLPSIKQFFYVELIIIIFIMIALSQILYIRFVRPIEVLQKAVAGYKGHLNIDRTRRFDEIGKLQNSFVQLAENLQEEKEKQNRIIASISHDIKTPLTSVMGYAERFKKGNLSPERTAKYLDIIYLKSLAIKDLVEEFDDYLSYNQKTALKKQEISVNDFMKIMNNDYEDELRHMGVNLIIENFCPSIMLQVDVLKMRRVFGSIIGNSLKHFKGNDKKIVISCTQADALVVFSVSDNGTGVEKEFLRKIFEPMYTSDEGRSVAGLGLAICDEIISNHGGEIWAENNEDGGLTIFLSIPV